MGRNIAAVILAAGRSERLGTPKQLIEWQGKSLINHAIDLVIECEISPIVVVLGAFYQKIKKNIVAQDNVKIIRNLDWKKGQSTSLIAGINAIQELNTPALILLCDQPCLTSTIVNGVIDAYESSNKLAAMVNTSGRKTPPVIVSPKLFRIIQELKGDRGARDILKNQQVAYYENNDDKAIMDIDTSEDLHQLKECA